MDFKSLLLSRNHSHATARRRNESQNLINFYLQITFERILRKTVLPDFVVQAFRRLKAPTSDTSSRETGSCFGLLRTT
jgi:hypothetical protein